MAAPPTSRPAQAKAPPSFPPTSKEFFILKYPPNPWDGEDHADGFVMEFHLTGRDFKIGIDLPRVAEHGPYMIIFYASFFHNDGTHSLVETGLSFSKVQHGWNFPDDTPPPNPKDKKSGTHNHLISWDLTKAGHLELCVSFKPDRHGGLINCSLNGIQNNAWVPRHQVPNKMRLVIAAGDRRGASFSDAGMTLETVDGKPPKASGHVKWQRGHKIADGDHRCVLKSATPFGMRCSLPHENKKPVAVTHPSNPKPNPEIDVPYVPSRPLSPNELRKALLMR